MTGKIVWESDSRALRPIERKRYELQYRDLLDHRLWWPISSFRFKWNAWLSAKSLEDIFVVRVADTKEERVLQSRYRRAFS